MDTTLPVEMTQIIILLLTASGIVPAMFVCRQWNAIVMGCVPRIREIARDYSLHVLNAGQL